MRGSWPIFYFFERLSTLIFSSNLSLSSSSLFLSIAPADSIPHKQRHLARKLVLEAKWLLMQGSASRRGVRGARKRWKGRRCCPAASEPTGLDLDNSLDDASLRPRFPRPPNRTPLSTVLCRKAAAEIVSSKNFQKAAAREEEEEAPMISRKAATWRRRSPSEGSPSFSPPPPPPPPPSSPPPFSSSCERSMPPSERRPRCLRRSKSPGPRPHRGLPQGEDAGRRQRPHYLGAVALEAEQLLDAGAPLEFSTEHGDTPLTVAAGGGSPQLVRMLLRRGADPKGSRGACTPPIHAAIEGALVDAFGKRFGSHDECVRLLLEAGADPRARDVPPGRAEEVKRREGGDLKEHWSALHRAALRGLPAVCSCCSRARARSSPTSRGPPGRRRWIWPCTGGIGKWSRCCEGPGRKEGSRGRGRRAALPAQFFVVFFFSPRVRRLLVFFFR